MTTVYLPDSEPRPRDLRAGGVARLARGSAHRRARQRQAQRRLRAGVRRRAAGRRDRRDRSRWSPRRARSGCRPTRRSRWPATSSTGCSRRPTSCSPALADCGSCTAYSVSDAIELEKAGQARGGRHHHQLRADRRHAVGELRPRRRRKLVLPHPLGGTDEPTLRAWVDAAVDDLISLFTTGTA